jgi:hypothetical protein
VLSVPRQDTSQIINRARDDAAPSVDRPVDWGGRLCVRACSPTRGKGCEQRFLLRRTEQAAGANHVQLFTICSHSVKGGVKSIGVPEHGAQDLSEDPSSLVRNHGGKGDPTDKDENKSHHKKSNTDQARICEGPICLNNIC